ncbi:MAG: carbon-nitrogen hydrolase family protein [Bacillota bacterium]
MKDFTVALCQMTVKESKEENLDKAVLMLRQAARSGCQLAVLPEMFNCPYDQKRFPVYAETVPDGPTCRMLTEAAAQNHIFIIGGSIPEKDADGRIYNTALAFAPDRGFTARHRKVHLFDVDLETVKFRESAALTPGSGTTIFETPWARVGLAICYDVRFPDFFRLMAVEGAEVIVLPAAFNRVTGAAHWEITMRMRAIDNQVYMVGVSPAADFGAGYVAYGHSMAVDPWGRILAAAGDDEDLLIAALKADELERVRREFPLLLHRRSDLYEIRTVSPAPLHDA